MANEEHHELARKQLEETFQIEQDWAQRAGVNIEPLETVKTKGSGTIEFGAFIEGGVVINLGLENGEKLQFNGTVIGELAGLTGGVGSYHGALPKAGDKWNFHMTVKDPGLGFITLVFNPVWGPRGIFVGGTAGAAVSIIGNGGGGVWTKG